MLEDEGRPSRAGVVEDDGQAVAGEGSRKGSVLPESTSATSLAAVGGHDRSAAKDGVKDERPAELRRPETVSDDVKISKGIGLESRALPPLRDIAPLPKPELKGPERIAIGSLAAPMDSVPMRPVTPEPPFHAQVGEPVPSSHEERLAVKAEYGLLSSASLLRDEPADVQLKGSEPTTEPMDPAVYDPEAPPPYPVDVADQDPSQGDGRQLNVSDALSYLDAVKQRFQDRPDVYNQFLDIMKDFKSQLIDTPGVIQRVSSLFRGHPALIQGFNTFLPVGYRIECTIDDNMITVTTPMGTMTQRAADGYFDIADDMGMAPAPMVVDTVPEPPVRLEGMHYTAEQISPAMAYVTKIKQRFANHPDLYQEFLDILNLYKREPPPPVADEGLVQRIARLFQNAPDLLQDFQMFMPPGSIPPADVLGILTEPGDKDEKIVEKPSRRKGESSMSSGKALPQKRKRKVVDREKDRERDREEKESEREIVPRPANKKSKLQPAADGNYAPYYPGAPTHSYNNAPMQREASPPVAGHDDTMFFERVKRSIDNRETYNEFLKLLNLFTQGIIDMRKLVDHSQYFLRDLELMAQFKEILGWDASWETDNRSMFPHPEQHVRPGPFYQKPTREDMNIRFGPSYYRLPSNEQEVTCSGRDDMCRSVLNDQWVSHPAWSNDDVGFVAHRKNQYEEALHRSEEERHEYDFHIEAAVRTIALLEPINVKMMSMSPEDRANFKLKPNFSGSSKSIHQRIIKKLYGRDAGMEVIQALHECPSMAVPIVLSRLKQKEEEWKRAQREWNKVWREVDARNYQKSLDHQGITFKVNDKKAMSSKSLLQQLETAKEEQLAKNACLIDPTFSRTRPRYQIALEIEDIQVLQDFLKLTLSFLDRVHGQINAMDRRRIEHFLRTFIPLFFMIDSHSFNSALALPIDGRESDANMSDDLASLLEDAGDDGLSAATSSRPGRSGKRSGAGDLRKKLLKSTAQDKPLRRTRVGTSSNPSSGRASPALSDAMAVDETSSTLPTNPDKAPEEQNGAGVNDVPSSKPPPPPSKPVRNGAFYANASFYCLLRLIETIHSRLLLCKTLAGKLASHPSLPYLQNPVASDLALLDSAPADPGLEEMRKRANPAGHFYTYLLESCERLFDNEIDQQTFEDITRFMFGTKAYLMFTVDKVIASIIKQVQTVLSDSKSHKLLDLLKQERALTSPSNQDTLGFRQNAERIIGGEDHIIRIDWLPGTKTVTFQLLNKDDFRHEDPEQVVKRWQAYVESFVSESNTSPVQLSSGRGPYLRRNLKSIPSDKRSQHIHGRSRLEIKVCMRTYRLFFVSNTEDVLWRTLTPAESQRGRDMSKLMASDSRWLSKFEKDVRTSTA